MTGDMFRNSYGVEFQASALLKLYPSIRRPNNDNTAFELPFNVHDSWNSLRIYLGNEFPEKAPST